MPAAVRLIDCKGDTSCARSSSPHASASRLGLTPRPHASASRPALTLCRLLILAPSLLILCLLACPRPADAQGYYQSPGYGGNCAIQSTSGTQTSKTPLTVNPNQPGLFATGMTFGSSLSLCGNIQTTFAWSASGPTGGPAGPPPQEVIVEQSCGVDTYSDGDPPGAATRH